MPPTNDQNTPVTNDPAAPASPPPPPTPGVPQPPVTSPPEPGSPPQPASPPPQITKDGLIQKLASPRAGFALFALAFAGIGGYIIFRSFAAPLLSNELALIKAFNNISKNKPTSVSTTATVTYTPSASTKAGSSTPPVTPLISLKSTTKLAKNGATQTTGELTAKKKTFSYDVRTLDGEVDFKVSNLSQLKDMLPAGAPLKTFLTERNDILARVSDNFYYYPPAREYTEDVSPEVEGLGCIFSTAWLPVNYEDYNEWNYLAAAYKNHKPFNVVRDKKTNVYTITTRDSKSLHGFLTAIADQDHGGRVNHCTNYLVHASATDKFEGAAQANLLTAKLTLKGNNITDITFTSKGAKSSVTVNAAFTYGGKSPKTIAYPDETYYGGGLPHVLVDPNEAKDPFLFSYDLASGWAADYCGHGMEYASVQLFASKPAATVPYCSWDNDANIGAYQFEYEEEDFSITEKNAKAKGIKNKIDQSDAQAALTKSANTKSSADDCDYTDTKKTVTIDGLKTARYEYLFTSDCYEAKAGTKYIYYDYYNDAEDTGSFVYRGFYGSYEYLAGTDPTDHTATFDKMVQSLDLKW